MPQTFRSGAFLYFAGLACRSTRGREQGDLAQRAARGVIRPHPRPVVIPARKTFALFVIYTPHRGLVENGGTARRTCDALLEAEPDRALLVSALPPTATDGHRLRGEVGRGTLPGLGPALLASLLSWRRPPPRAAQGSAGHGPAGPVPCNFPRPCAGLRGLRGRQAGPGCPRPGPFRSTPSPIPWPSGAL